MSTHRCPTDLELVAYADADASPEQLASTRSHLTTCPKCRLYVNGLEQLIGDVAAPLPAVDLDVHAHTRAILGRLETSDARREPRRLPWAWLGLTAVAAALGLLVVPSLTEPPASNDEWTARGGAAGHSLGRDVGVRFYVQESPGQALGDGSRIRRGAAWTAEWRNVGSEPAYALLFLVDSSSTVHWVAPGYDDPSAPPSSLAVTPSAVPRRLGTHVVFEDLALGKARLIEVLTTAPVSVLEVEDLPSEALTSEGLQAHFSDAELREFSVEITP